MESSDIYNAMLDALAEHARRQEESAPRLSPGMVAIEPFDAVNFDDEACRAVGIVTNPGSDDLDFVVLKELANGEIVPATEASLWRRLARGSSN